MYRLLLLLFITKIGYSQTKIKGEVIDGQTSETLIGANILIKGAKVGTATDYNGNFILETTKQLPLTLEITYLGYKNKEILIEQSNNIKIKLVESTLRSSELKAVSINPVAKIGKGVVRGYLSILKCAQNQSCWIIFIRVLFVFVSHGALLHS